MTTKGLQLDAYIRVSKVGGRKGESFISPDEQRREIEAWAKAHGALVTFHEPELDRSGGTMDRPVFNQIMERVRSGQTQGIICAKLDRFARSVIGALNTIEEMEQHGAVLVVTRDNIDLSTPMGRAFMRIMLVFAELERERIAENFDAATRNAIARGVAIINGPIFGYDKPNGHLVPNAEAPIAREVFLRRGAGKGVASLAKFLNQKAPLDGKQWTIQRVWRMLSTRAYMGHVHYGDHVNTEAHPAIVSEIEWERAQAAKSASSPRTKSPALLSGLVRCGSCRYTLAPSNAGKQPIYRCRKHHTTGDCPAPAHIRRERLEQHVEKLFLDAMAEREVLASTDVDSTLLSDQIKALRGELREFAADVTARSILGSDGFHEALVSRQDRIQALESELSEALAASSIDQFDIAGWPDLDIEGKRTVLASAIDAVVIAPAESHNNVEDRVTVLWTGEGPEDLPRRRHDNGPIRPFAHR